MRLLVANDEGLRRQFLTYYEKRYIQDPLKRNSLSGLLKALLRGTSVMCRSAYLEPVMVEEAGKILMIALLAQADRMADCLQIAFFEADERNDEAFGLILDRALTLARERGAVKVTGSLNIHVNYGLGFLASDFDGAQGFGTMHNPAFYNELFRDHGFLPVEMVSFRKDLKDLAAILDPRITSRLARRYTIRSLDYHQLPRDAEIYTRINNEAFAQHLFYYPRRAEEDLELFRDFKPLLRPENLLFAFRGDKPIGFMLWYPDFHELMRPGETLGVKTVVKNRLLPNRIRTVKIVEMGVVPCEQRHGAILALMDHAFALARGRYDYFESGWILQANDRSRLLGDRLADGQSKHYCAWIREVTP